MVEISGSLVAAECWRARETIPKPRLRHKAGKVVEVEHDAQLNHPTFVGCGTNVIRFCWLIARMGRMVDVATALFSNSGDR